ncbi:hypothetical protein [Burkholderia sp. MSMB1589WGS]|uniref:hypothetical protein n=1 Tax=Burkholderia sp. MSMB1589WGS TaxID=1636425 RepID=UPI001E3C7667|nr:hypothetical protein [Burkholderia sp. MSMB1589WGS]
MTFMSWRFLARCARWPREAAWSGSSWPERMGRRASAIVEDLPFWRIDKSTIVHFNRHRRGNAAAIRWGGTERAAAIAISPRPTARSDFAHPCADARNRFVSLRGMAASNVTYRNVSVRVVARQAAVTLRILNRRMK